MSSSKKEPEKNNTESSKNVCSIPCSMKTAAEIVATKYLKNGTIIESSNTRRRFEVIEFIKRGNLCVIVKLQERNVPAWQKNRVFALKAECGPVMNEEAGLKLELNILSKAAEARRLRPAMVDNLVEIYDRGITDHFRFIIINSLGMNISDLQKSVRGLPIQTAVRINKRMFNAIRNLHNLGYIHRNIQPSNFAIGSRTEAAVVFIIGFSMASRIELNSSGTEIEIMKSLNESRRMNTLNSVYMSRRCHTTLNLTRLDDIESWLFSCLEVCVMGSLPWKRGCIPSESLEMKKNFFYHQYTFELFFERLPPDYRRLIDVINAAIPKSTPDYLKICEINDKICKQFPILHRKKTAPIPVAASPVLETTRSLMLPTICLPPTPLTHNKNNNVVEEAHSFYGIPPAQDVFGLKGGKPKDAVKKTSAPLPIPVSNYAKKKSNTPPTLATGGNKKKK